METDGRPRDIAGRAAWAYDLKGDRTSSAPRTVDGRGSGFKDRIREH